MKTSQLAEACLRCKYIGYGTARNNHYLPGLVCDYYLITGKRRGCPPGEGCDKHEPKEEEHEPTDFL